MSSFEQFPYKTGDIEVDEALYQFCQNKTVHSLCFVTYEQVLEKVWERMMRHEKKDEIMQRLKQEVKDSKRMFDRQSGGTSCFTGKLTRLVNCLVHYYDDIQMNISDNDQINAKIIAAKEVVLRENQVADLFSNELIDKWYNLAYSYLQEINIPDDDIKAWLSHINELKNDFEETVPQEVVPQEAVAGEGGSAQHDDSVRPPDPQYFDTLI
jgi:hypothetical protein